MIDYNPENFSKQGGFRHHDSQIFEYVVLVNLGKFNIGRGVRIDSLCHISGGEGVKIGPRTHIAANVTVSGGGKFETGWCCGVAAGTRIVTGSDKPLYGLAGPCIPEEFRSYYRSSVIMHDFSIVFTNSIILPGAVIGEGAVVYANTMVPPDYELDPWGVYAGNPIRKVRERDKDMVLKLASAMKTKYGY